MARKRTIVSKDKIQLQLSSMNNKSSSLKSDFSNLARYDFKGLFKLNECQEIDINSDLFKVYSFLHFYKIDLFCLVSVDQFATSSEVGYLSPKELSEWDADLVLYPEYDLLDIAKNSDKPIIFIKVPLKWAIGSKVVCPKRIQSVPSNIEFISTFNKMHPFVEIFDTCINEKHRKEIEVLSKTYGVSGDYTAKTKWKTAQDIHLTHTQPIIDYALMDRLLGGVVVSAVEEIFGILIDKGKIERNKKYIEPFSGYAIRFKSRDYLFNRVIMGRQGFSLLYSIESFIENKTISNVQICEDTYANKAFRVFYDCEKIEEIKSDLSRSFIWIIPLIIKHLDDIESDEYDRFINELENVLELNGVELSMGNVFAVVLFAKISSLAIHRKLWSSSLEGIKEASHIINKLFEQFGKKDADYTKKNDLLDFMNTFNDVSKYIKEYKLKEAVENSLNKKFDSEYLSIVFKSLSVLLATDTMAKDWYNVFNRAFNSKIDDLEFLFPVLGAWMGFYHGYRKINRQKHYNFSNDSYLESLFTHMVKCFCNETAITNGFEEKEIKGISQEKHYNKNIQLAICKYKNGFEYPFLRIDNQFEFRKLNHDLKRLRELESKLAERSIIDREIASLIKNKTV